MEFGIGTSGQLLLPAGALVGLTCSTLWTSLGIYTKNLSRAYDSELGKNSETEGSLGFFNGITDRAAPQLGGLTALTGSTLLLTLTGSRKLLYSLVTASLVTGNLLFLLLPKHGDTDPTEIPQKTADSDAPRRSFIQSLMAVPRLLLTSSAARKISLCYLSVGFSQSYTTGSFTADAVAKEVGPAFVGAIMATNNTMEVVSALLFGRLSDKLGRYPCYLGALLFELVNPLFFALFPVVVNGNRKTLMVFLAACLGIGSGGCTCCLRSLVGDLFQGEEETSTAMSTTFFVLSFTAGSGFYLGPNYGLRTKARLYLCLIMLSLFGSSAAVSALKSKPAPKQAELAAAPSSEATSVA